MKVAQASWSWARIMSQWTWLNLHTSHCKLVNGHSFLSFLSARFLTASLCERCVFLPTHLSSSSATTAQPKSGSSPICLKRCLQIMLNLGSVIRTSQNIHIFLWLYWQITQNRFADWCDVGLYFIYQQLQLRRIRLQPPWDSCNTWT